MKSPRNAPTKSSIISKSESSTNRNTKNRSSRKTQTTTIGSSYLIIKQRRRKILLLIATVSIAFAVLWLPVHIFNIWRHLFQFSYSDLMYIMKLIAHTLSYSNSCVNPFVYVFMGTKFRAYFSIELRNFINFITCEKRESKASNDSIYHHYSRHQTHSIYQNNNNNQQQHSTLNQENIKKFDSAKRKDSTEFSNFKHTYLQLKQAKS